jgi:hypothetical protein
MHRFHHPGHRLFLPSDSNTSAFSAVFEDDGQTAYFYAYDRSRPAQRILDAVHVYNVEAVLDRHKPSELVIHWSDDGLKAGLLINDRLWAVLDFAAGKAYSRTNFPERSAWDGQPRDAWHDRLASLLI